MHPTLLAIVLILSGTACAHQLGTPGSTNSTGEAQPVWQQFLDQAHRDAAAGRNTALIVTPLQASAHFSGGVYVFYNNAHPFCYTYMIPGEWVAGEQPNSYRSKDGQAFAGVLFGLPGNLDGVEGITLVEKAWNLTTLQHEEAVGQRLSDVKLRPFNSRRFTAWRWLAAPVTKGDQEIVFPMKIIVDLSPAAVVQITVAGTPDNDGIARRIINSLRTTSIPTCYWPVLEEMLKSTHHAG